MKTLYVTDLDGTLLDSGAKVSEYTQKTLNELIDSGMCFSYATARSLVSASVITAGINIRAPVIVHNGAFITDPRTKEKISSVFFDESEKKLAIDIFAAYSVSPASYGIIGNEEKVSWRIDRESKGMINYRASRKGDKRLRPVGTDEELYSGDLYCFIAMGEKAELTGLYESLKRPDAFYCTLQKEMYTGDYWCEMTPKNANKGNAIRTLKEMMKCDRVVCFGDAVNDIPMFKAADESYAVENAEDELKKYAAGIIAPNGKDGVARWLKEHWTCSMTDLVE